MKKIKSMILLLLNMAVCFISWADDEDIPTIGVPIIALDQTARPDDRDTMRLNVDARTLSSSRRPYSIYIWANAEFIYSLPNPADPGSRIYLTATRRFRSSVVINPGEETWQYLLYGGVPRNAFEFTRGQNARFEGLNLSLENTLTLDYHLDPYESERSYGPEYFANGYPYSAALPVSEPGVSIHEDVISQDVPAVTIRVAMVNYIPMYRNYTVLNVPLNFTYTFRNRATRALTTVSVPRIYQVDHPSDGYGAIETTVQYPTVSQALIDRLRSQDLIFVNVRVSIRRYSEYLALQIPQNGTEYSFTDGRALDGSFIEDNNPNDNAPGDHSVASSSRSDSFDASMEACLWAATNYSDFWGARRLTTNLSSMTSKPYNGVTMLKVKSSKERATDPNNLVTVDRTEIYYKNYMVLKRDGLPRPGLPTTRNIGHSTLKKYKIKSIYGLEQTFKLRNKYYNNFGDWLLDLQLRVNGYYVSHYSTRIVNSNNTVTASSLISVK